MECDRLLVLLNEQVGNQGFLRPNCDLIFFSPVLCYKINLNCEIGFQIFTFDRIRPDLGWRYVGRGTLAQMVTTLNADETTFLTACQISTYWCELPA